MIPPVQQSFPKNHPTLEIFRDAQPWGSGVICSEHFVCGVIKARMTREVAKLQNILTGRWLNLWPIYGTEQNTLYEDVLSSL